MGKIGKVPTWQIVLIVLAVLFVFGGMSNCTRGNGDADNRDQESHQKESEKVDEPRSADEAEEAKADDQEQRDPSWRIVNNGGDFDVSVVSVTDAGVELSYANNESGDFDMYEFIDAVVVGEDRYDVYSGSVHMAVNGEDASTFMFQLGQGESADVLYAVDGMTQADYEQGFGLQFDETSYLNTHDASGAKTQERFDLKSLSLRAEMR